MRGLISAIGVLCLVIFQLIFLLKKFHQPYLIAYILAGVLLGWHSLHVLADGAYSDRRPLGAANRKKPDDQS